MMPPTWSSHCARPSRWPHSIRDYKKLQSSLASDWLRFRRRLVGWACNESGEESIHLLDIDGLAKARPSPGEPGTYGGSFRGPGIPDALPELSRNTTGASITP